MEIYEYLVVELNLVLLFATLQIGITYIQISILYDIFNCSHYNLDIIVKPAGQLGLYCCMD